MNRRVVASALVLSMVLVGCGTAPSGSDGGTGGGTGGGGSVADSGTGGGGGSAADAGSVGTVVDVAAGNTDFSILVAAVQKAGLASTLSDPTKKFTVFAPNNAAFTALLTQLGVTNGLDGLSAEQLKPILLYHVVGSEIRATAATAAASANQKVSTLGGKVQLSLNGSTIRIDGRASVTTADLAASNGVIHVIDAVILPSITDIATTDARFSSLTAALVLADTGSPSPNLVTTLDDDTASLTVFAPTDDAFTALVTALKGSDNGAATGISALTSFRPDQLTPVLTYHVVGSKILAAAVPASATVDTLGGKVAVTRSGSAVTVDGASVVVADVLASNGVIHAINKVILPSITDVVTTSSTLTSLKAAVLAADGAAGTTPKVAVALDGAGPFTLFAPSNAAFTALGTPPSGQSLTDVLLYHAVPGNPVYAAAALSLTQPLSVATALTSRSLSVAAEGSPKGVTVADSTTTKANVSGTNFFTSNGVIHVVDKVLIPAP